ncbi:MAG: hypothetical protein FWH38_06830 [Treponema sp.]|nr:hypothetical protein [Treponema sp.]
MNGILNLLPVFIILAVALTVIFTELIKRLDKKNRLKGFRVCIPMALSFVFACLLQLGNFFAAGQMWFWQAAIFGFSVFGYEAVLRKLQNALGPGGKDGDEAQKKGDAVA